MLVNKCTIGLSGPSYKVNSELGLRPRSADTENPLDVDNIDIATSPSDLKSEHLY